MKSIMGDIRYFQRGLDEELYRLMDIESNWEATWISRLEMLWEELTPLFTV